VLSRECDVSAWVLFSGPKTTCFGSYGHLNFDRQQTCKQLYFGMRLVYGRRGLGLDGGTRSHVC